jgi:hypothetical protein
MTHFPTGRRRECLRHSSRFPIPMAIFAAMTLTMTLTGAIAPVPSPSDTLNSGTEGTKAALVRIELRAVAEIAHVDHTTGEVEIKSGQSTVPLGSATGVLTSADGIVATTWENLDVDEDAVAVYAGNELFAQEMGVSILGNDGDPARRGYTPDPYWAPHLQHCYDQVTHCILFHVPEYHVRTYTAESGGVNAELLNAPSDPRDVALLRISGGGGAPTAQLAAPDAASGADTAILGFTGRPTTEAGPVEIPSSVDTAADRIESTDELTPPLDAGVSGGPVVDRTTGQVLGLAGPLEEDGSATFVPASEIQTAMEKEKVDASSSKFDAVFRRGIDHLSAGNPSGSESALEEALTYYDSALAIRHRDEARALAGEQANSAPAGGTADTGPQGSLPVAFLPILTGILLLAGIIVAIVMRRRGRSGSDPTGGTSASAAGNRPRGSGSGPTGGTSASAAGHRPRGSGSGPTGGTSASAAGNRPRGSGSGPTGGTSASAAGNRRASAPAVAASSVIQDPKDQSSGNEEMPARSTAPGMEREQTGGRAPRSHERSESTTWTRSAEYHVPGEPHSTASTAEAPSAPETNVQATPESNGNGAHAAGHVPPRAAGGFIPAFCTQCGRSLSQGARFCAYCGHPVG